MKMNHVFYEIYLGKDGLKNPENMERFSPSDALIVQVIAEVEVVIVYFEWLVYTVDISI